jgi:hypothetical protein
VPQQEVVPPPDQQVELPPDQQHQQEPEAPSSPPPPPPDIDWDPSDPELPDNTQFEAYSQAQARVRDEILDNGSSDFVLVDLTTHDHDHVGEQVLLFDRNNVKKDVFHVLKDWYIATRRRQRRDVTN